MISSFFIDEIIENLLPVQQRDEKVDQYTAKPSTNQGNLDVEEMKKIDPTAQCPKCLLHTAEGNSFCSGGKTLPDLAVLRRHHDQSKRIKEESWWQS